MANAPIAVFIFKRPAHTRRAMESLAQNPEFIDSLLFIYCDGGRNAAESAEVAETRELVRDWPHPNKTIVERDRNWGLANSVIEGVGELCKRFGRVIVVEDDLVVSPVFLNYLNTALERYADEPKVMQVSGYMFPIGEGNANEAVMLPITSTWGWATWDRAWKNFGVTENDIIKLLTDATRKRAFDLDGSYPYIRRLKKQLRGKTDSWGIQWYLSVFKLDGMVVYPPVTLVQNIGHDGSGTHCKVEAMQENIAIFSNSENIAFPKYIFISSDCFKKVKKYLRNENRIIFRGWAWLRTEIKNKLNKLI